MTLSFSTLPAAQDSQCSTQDPIADRDDETRLLGESNEDLGADVITTTTHPTDQCFTTLDFPRGQRDHGLHEKIELVALDRMAKFRLHGEPFDRHRPHFLVEDLDATSPQGLRPGKSCVRVSQYRVGRRRGVPQCNAGGRRQVELAPLDIERAGQAPHQLPHEAEGPVGLETDEYDDERVGGEMSNDAVRGHEWGEPAGRGSEHHVTESVPEGVVDPSEVVDVDEGDGERLYLRHLRVEPIEKAPPVGQIRNRVLERQSTQIRLVGAQRRDIGGADHDA